MTAAIKKTVVILVVAFLCYYVWSSPSTASAGLSALARGTVHVLKVAADTVVSLINGLIHK